MQKILLFTLPIFLYLTSNSQSLSSNPELSFQPSYIDLYSTHGNHFKGSSLLLQKRLSGHFSAGIGTEYAYSRFHNDNGWRLSNLRFLPVYADQQYQFSNNSIMCPIFRLSQGITYATYNKDYLVQGVPRRRIKELGVYGYVGTGLLCRVSKSMRFSIEGGLKAYHLSFNAFDVNPHGIAGKIGLIM